MCEEQVSRTGGGEKISLPLERDGTTICTQIESELLVEAVTKNILHQP
jgi:hypothetical protein